MPAALEGDGKTGVDDVGGLTAGAMTSMVLIVEFFLEGVEEEKTP